MNRLERNWSSENTKAADDRKDEERLKQVAGSLSPSTPLLRSHTSDDDNDGSERVRSRRSRNSWTTVQARRAVDNHQRLRSAPDVHQSSGRSWTHEPGGQDESPSSLLPGAYAYQREQQPWEQQHQRRYRSRQSVPASLTHSLYIHPLAPFLSRLASPLSLRRVWGEMYRHPSTFPAEPRQFRTHLTVDKAHTDPFRSGRFFSGFCNLKPRLLFHPFVRLGVLSLFFFFFFSARVSVLYLPCAFLFTIIYYSYYFFFQLSNAVGGCPFLFFTLKIAQRLLVGRTLLLL